MQPSFQAEFSGDTADVYSAAFAALPIAAQYGFAIAFGLVIGSFLTVVIHRLPVMLERAWKAEAEPDTAAYAPRYNLAVPRSACPHCGHVLKPWENIPVISYVLQRGRCAACRIHINARYPLTELATALLAAASLYVFGPSLTALAAFALCAMLLVMSLIDFDTRYLPDTLTLPLLWAGLIVNLDGRYGFATLHAAVAGAALGYLFLWCVYWLFKLVRGVEGMGYGDFKLLGALGAWLGWQALPQIVLVSAVAGALVGLTAMATRKMRFDEPLPFGPFLAAGGAITLFFGTPFYTLFGS